VTRPRPAVAALRAARLAVLLVAMPWTGLGAARAASAGDAFDRAACALHGRPLYGKVQVVTAFPDLRVQVVDAFPDLRVQVVTAFPDRCGKWAFVEAFPDLRVQFVDAFPDLRIEYVRAFPGLR